MAELRPSPPPYAKELKPGSQSPYKFSICTLVTKWDEYRIMADSFIQAGFEPSSCEYLYIDNSNGNQADAFGGCNLFLNNAQGEFIILCHQDIVLQKDRREDLERCIRQLDVLDASWALLGNAGGVKLGETAFRITDEWGSHNSGNLPVRVQTLDENFILARRSANLTLSSDLSGFHLYGTELCQVAQALGRTAWVVDFNLYHKSIGKLDEGFFALRDRLQEKYRVLYAGHDLQTTCATIRFGGGRWADDHRLFLRLYELQKHEGGDEGSRERFENFKTRFALSRPKYLVHWFFHKVTRPLQNLQTSLVRRVNKT
jgi:hypothetical protein